jgi:hypothetical protein
MENKSIWWLTSRSGVTPLAETEEQARQAVADYEPLEARKKGWLDPELSYCTKSEIYENGVISYQLGED